MLEVENLTNRDAIAMRRMRKSASEMLPLLQDVAERGLAAMRKEAERLGVVFTKDMAQAADAFNDNLTRMKFGLEGLARYIAGPFMVGMTEFLKIIGFVQTTQAEMIRKRQIAIQDEMTQIGKLREHVERQGPGEGREAAFTRLDDQMRAFNTEASGCRRTWISHRTPSEAEDWTHRGAG